MTSDQLRDIETELGLTHAGLPQLLGVSEVCVKRMATGTQIITEQTGKQLVSLFLIEREGLINKYHKALAKYRHDTIMESISGATRTAK